MGDVRRGGRTPLRSGAFGRPAVARSSRGSHTSRTLTPITTVSSPLNLGMNLSPRRISASLRGRNRHITLMLHSAGSAISAGGREGARGWVGGRGSAGRGRRPRTAPPAARPPPAASDEASQQVIANSAGWAARAAPRPGRFLSASGPSGCRPAFPGLALTRRGAPGPPARDHAAGGRGDAQGASLARLRPPGLLRAQPSCISTSALDRLPGPPLRPAHLRLAPGR